MVQAAECLGPWVSTLRFSVNRSASGMRQIRLVVQWWIRILDRQQSLSLTFSCTQVSILTPPMSLSPSE